ncbi:hypothetical protein I3843_02G019200 [Carya illinoinensis]|nr:hypothetical protein I3843_02G019200 [Carya illinoinensis]
MLEDYVDIFVSEIYAGNHPRTHFNKIGWKIICYKQLKNKWDSLKNDWNIWTKFVGRETSFGWDSVKKTIEAMDEWWGKKSYKYYEIQEAAKFCNAGLAHIFELDIMFRGIIATGEGAWAPSFGLNFEDIIRFD